MFLLCRTIMAYLQPGAYSYSRETRGSDSVPQLSCNCWRCSVGVNRDSTEWPSRCTHVAIPFSCQCQLTRKNVVSGGGGVLPWRRGGQCSVRACAAVLRRLDACSESPRPRSSCNPRRLSGRTTLHPTNYITHTQTSPVWRSASREVYREPPSSSSMQRSATRMHRFC